MFMLLVRNAYISGLMLSSFKIHSTRDETRALLAMDEQCFSMAHGQASSTNPIEDRQAPES